MIAKINKSVLIVIAAFLLHVNAIAIFADGLPMEYLTSEQWRLCARKYSSLSNPAFLTEHPYLYLYGAMSVAPDETSRLWESGISIPLGLYRSIGFTVAGENGHDIAVVTENVLLNPLDEPVSYVNNNNFAFVLAYASNPLGKLSFGINAKGLYQGNFGKPVFGAALDLGLSYRLFIHPAAGYHFVGLTMNNVFAQDLNLYDEMKPSGNVSLFYEAELFNRMIDIEVSADVNDIFAGKEYFTEKKNVEWDLSLVAGIHLFSLLRLTGNIESDALNKIKYWGFSTEINIPQLNGGRDIAATYQYRNSVHSAIQPSHTFYYRIEAGKHREEIYARKIAQSGNILESELYNRGMKFYYDGKYWEAYLTLKQLYTTYPDFFKNDKASLYAALSLEKMDFRNNALELLSLTIQKYPLSDVVASCNLAMMRIHYRNGDFASARAQMDQLHKINVSDSIRQHGIYIVGEMDLAEKEFVTGARYLAIIPEGHPDYIFAQYSIASARLNTNEDYALVINNLENCISTETQTPEQNEIKNKAFITLGYIYYEEKTLSKAVVAFRLVPSSSIYYDDALLGLGWTAIKARQWKDCVDAGEKLSQNSKRVIMQSEGKLIQAYGYIMQKKYQNAFDILTNASNRITNYIGVSQDTLYSEKFMYENNRLKYNRLGDEIRHDNVSYNPESKPLDSLHQQQISIYGDIKKHYLYTDECSRLDIFNRSIEKVKEDINFTLSKTQKLMLGSGSQKIIEKDKAINDELKALKEQMKKLDNK
jgi:tetratricopeptide (TPR) repeat protein